MAQSAYFYFHNQLRVRALVGELATASSENRVRVVCVVIFSFACLALLMSVLSTSGHICVPPLLGTLTYAPPQNTRKGDGVGVCSTCPRPVNFTQLLLHEASRSCPSQVSEQTCAYVVYWVTRIRHESENGKHYLCNTISTRILMIFGRHFDDAQKCQRYN